MIPHIGTNGLELLNRKHAHVCVYVSIEIDDVYMYVRSIQITEFGVFVWTRNE